MKNTADHSFSTGKGSLISTGFLHGFTVQLAVWRLNEHIEAFCSPPAGPVKGYAAVRIRLPAARFGAARAV